MKDNLKNNLRKYFKDGFVAVSTIIDKLDRIKALKQEIPVLKAKLNKTIIFKKKLDKLALFEKESDLLFFTGASMTALRLANESTENHYKRKRLSEELLRKEEELAILSAKDVFASILKRQSYPLKQYKGVYIGIKADGFITVGVAYDVKENIIVREVLMRNEKDDDNAANLMFSSLIRKVNLEYSDNWIPEKETKLASLSLARNMQEELDKLLAERRRERYIDFNSVSLDLIFPHRKS